MNDAACLGLVGVAALTLALGCGGPAPPGEDDANTDPNVCKGVARGAVGPGAFASDYATSSQFFTQMHGLNPDGASIHGATQIWYSCNLHGLLDATTLEVPEGTVAIKLQDQTGDGVPDGMRVMIKHAKGYDSAHGDFEYQARSASGAYQGSGGPAFCFGCHAGYSGTGYLAGTSIVD